MQQNRECRNKPTQICSIDFWQRCKEFNGEMINSIGAIGHSYIRNKPWPKPHTPKGL